MCGTLVTLPPELHDIIIGFLYDDIPTLTSCVLVCKDWLPSSRSRLFRKLKIKPRTAQKFLPLLESPLHGPAIAPYVRELHIVEGYGSEAWFNEGLPVVCLGVLRSVTSLHVDLLQWVELSKESRAAFMSFLRSVEELILDACEFETFDQFTKVVSEPRSLRKLEVVCTEWGYGRSYAGLDRLPCPSQLQALHFERCEIPLWRWLLQHKSCHRTLKTIKVDSFSLELQSIELFGQLLRALGSTLESLTVEVSNSEFSFYLSLFQFHKSG
jgi:hypothetical protein